MDKVLRPKAEKERGKAKADKMSLKEIITETADQSAHKVVALQHQRQAANHYRAMEDLLWAYPKRVRMMKHPEEFKFFPTGHSKDISIAPPPGTGVVDKIEAAEMYTEARKRAYEHEIFRLHETEYAMAPFMDRPEFVIIRMFYFNEDVNGNYRGNDAKRLTWEEIAGELETIGIHRSETVIRRWRSALVREMTVMMFGADGALSIESRTRKDNSKEEEHGSQEADHDGEILSVQQEGQEVSAQ